MAAAARRKTQIGGSSFIQGQGTDPSSIGTRFLLETDRTALPSNWSYIRRQVALCLRSGVYQGSISAFICITVGFVVLDTDARAKQTSRQLWMTHCNYAVSTVYFVEIAARLFVSRVKFFKDGWDIFDLSVVIADAFSILTEVIFGSPEASFSWLRLLRVVRVLRLFRVFKHFHELNMLVHGLASALKAIVWATILMSMCLLVWSIVAVELIQPIVEDITAAGGFSGCPRCKKAFASVSQAFLTFVQTIVAGDSWGTYAIPVVDEAPAAFILFILVTATIQFGLMNLILAVIVDRAQQARLDDTEMQLGELQDKFIEANRSLLKWCKEMDCDGKGYITREDLLNGWQRIDEFRDAMKLWNLTQKDLDVVFEVLDTDNSNTLTYAEFVEQLFTLTNADLNTIFIYTLHHINRMMEGHTTRLDGVFSGRSSARSQTSGQTSVQSSVQTRAWKGHEKDVEFDTGHSSVVEKGRFAKARPGTVHELDTPVADTATTIGASRQTANRRLYHDLVTVPFFDELRVVGDKSWTETLDDFGASMVSLQSDIEQELNRLKDKIRDQDTELTKIGEGLLAHLQYAPRVLPEQCIRQHGQLFKRLQVTERTLRESACIVLSQIGRQMASIAEMEGFIAHKSGSDPKLGKPGLVFL